MAVFMRFAARDEPIGVSFLDSLHSGLVNERTQNVQFLKMSLAASDAQLLGAKGYFQGGKSSTHEKVYSIVPDVTEH